MKILKYHPNGSVLFITFSIEEGLLLLSNPPCECLLKSCLARAQHLYPLTISAFVIEANHVHIIAVVRNPTDVSDFIRYFKTESAHMLNRILGRGKRTIWCEGYDSPIVLTPVRTLIALTYLYANPAKDNLEVSIEKYPGLSSWEMFRTGVHTKNWKRLRRPAFKELAPDSHNLRGYTKEAERILSEVTKTHTFRIDPNAWMLAFGITDPKELESINTRLVERVPEIEKRASEKRKSLGQPVIGRERLLKQTLNTTFRSKRSGKRMCCLSEDRSLRISFINYLKDIYHKAREVAAKWKLGDFSEMFPLGLYPPSMPKLAEPIAGAW